MGWQTHVRHGKQVQKRIREGYKTLQMRLRWQKGSYLDVTWGGHTTRTQDEASREGGRDCGCVVGVVVVGFGGDRGRRGG